MKKRLLFILSIIISVSGFSFAQTKTITNNSLEKFRQKRLQAERDYRENYERLGFPSPEELAEQIEQDRKELSALSERLRNERMQREAMQREEEYRKAQLEIMRFTAGTYANQGAAYGNGFYPNVFYGGYPSYGFPGGVFYGNNYWTGGRVWRGGNFYNPVTPGTVFPPRGGVRINTNGVRISVTRGGRFPAPIRAPR